MTDKSGPAFPTNGHATGMTLRDYFAGQVLPSVANHVIGFTDQRSLKELMEQHNCPSVESFVSKLAYAYADAMLEERKC